MSATRASANQTSQPVHSCVPDPFLTEGRLASIFEDFTAEILRFIPAGTVFTHLVNNVRTHYISQLLQQQQVLADRSAQYELQLASERENRLAEVAELRAEHDRRVSELIDTHNHQMTTILNRERKVEPAARSRWISSIEVFFNNEGGYDLCDRITELNGKPIDINTGLGGPAVWLVPKFQAERMGAATSIEITVTSTPDGRRDLTGGCPGFYRYLTLRSTLSSFKIHTVNLLRLSQRMERLPEGFTGCTSNIIADRGGDYLYLIWKASPAGVEK